MSTEQEIVEELEKEIAYTEKKLTAMRADGPRIHETHIAYWEGSLSAKKCFVEKLKSLAAIRSLPVPSEASGEGDFVMVDRVANEELRRICIENADETAALHTALRELAEVSKRMKEALGLSFEGLDDYWVTTPDGSYAWHEIHSSRADYTDWLSRHRSLLDGAPKKEATQ